MSCYLFQILTRAAIQGHSFLAASCPPTTRLRTTFLFPHGMEAALSETRKDAFFLSVSHRTAFLQYFHTYLLWTEPWSSNGKAANSHFLTDLMGDFNVNPPCFSWPSGKIYGKQIVSKSNEKQQAEILVNFVEANFMENYQHCHKREIKMT